jgi:tellurite resistance protein
MGLMDLFRKKDPRPSAIETRRPTSEPAWSVRLEIPSRGQAPSPNGVASWLPPGQTCQVAGRTIAGGGFYVGSRAAAAQARIVEPALIDPGLKVNWDRPDWSGDTMGYWPSYSELTPNARAAYLSWLSGPRSDPSTYIGYVFMYFYGLERRALHELRLDPNHPELGAISAEVRRLLDTYGNGSFQSYGSRFLAILEVSQAATGELTPPSGDLPRSWEVPFLVRVALGRYCAAGQPIPGEWALVWLRTHPESYLRTPATRCAAEFDELFRHRYRARFKDGMVIKPPKAMLVVSYDTASAGFQRAVETSVGSLPDLGKLTGPVNKLKDIAADCTDALDSYSRYLGRNPDGAGTPGAIALLPDELLATYGGPAIDALRTWCREVTVDGAAAVPLDEVIERWSPGRTAKLAKAEAVAIGGLVGKLGVGIEPDVRFGASTPAPGSTVVMFSLPPGATDAPSPEYAAAATLVHLAAVVATSDGSVTDAERRHLAEHLETVLGLDPAERVRLEAHLLWLAGAKSGLGGLKKRIDALSQPRRAAVGQFLVDVAASDGLVTPDEITMLTKLYKLLGLEESAVYSAVHALGAADAGPVPLTTPGPDEVRWPIPPAAEEAPATVRLDPDKIRARLAETATVTALLADIFTEDDEPAAPAASPAAVEDSTVAGLDGPHSALAVRLSSQPIWARAELEAVATELALPMLDAALDRVNDAAIEACGEPLVEGDDPYEVNDFATQELF